MFFPWALGPLALHHFSLGFTSAFPSVECGVVRSPWICLKDGECRAPDCSWLFRWCDFDMHTLLVMLINALKQRRLPSMQPCQSSEGHCRLAGRSFCRGGSEEMFPVGLIGHFSISSSRLRSQVVLHTMGTRSLKPYFRRMTTEAPAEDPRLLTPAGYRGCFSAFPLYTQYHPSYLVRHQAWL